MAMIVSIFIFIFGSIIGSLLNVCIYRIPRDESIIAPRSHCPGCNNLIRWYDNIPFISYIMLMARCRYCKERISFRYFIVELLFGSLFLLLFLNFGISMKFLSYAILTSCLIVLTFIDFEHQLIPDQITIPGVIMGLAFSIIYPPLQQQDNILISLLYSVLGILAGGGSIYIVGVVAKFLLKKEAMGGGDVMLLGMAGAYLGPKLILLTFFIAPIFGSLAGIFVLLRHRTNIIPYGPYLSLGCLVSILWGEKIINWYFRFITGG